MLHVPEHHNSPLLREAEARWVHAFLLTRHAARQAAAGRERCRFASLSLNGRRRNQSFTLHSRMRQRSATYPQVRLLSHCHCKSDPPIQVRLSSDFPTSKSNSHRKSDCPTCPTCKSDSHSKSDCPTPTCKSDRPTAHAPVLPPPINPPFYFD